MKKIAAFLLSPLLFAASALAQPGPGPGPAPNPWVVSGSTISYSNGGILVGATVTGGTKGAGTINAAGLYVNGNNNLNLIAAGTWAGSTAITTLGTIATGTWNGTIISGAWGGTGANNSGKTITLGASITTTGVGAPTLAFPSSSFTYTYPTASKTLMASDYSNGTTLTANAFVTGGGAGTAPNAVALTGIVVGNGASPPTASTLTSLLDGLGSTQGSILYRNASVWVPLTPGTAGFVLSTGGASANPSWVTPPAFSAVQGTVTAAATTDLSAAGNVVQTITGNTAITSFGAGANLYRIVRFTGSPVITNNGTSLVTGTGANIQASPGDTATLSSDGSGNWTIISYAPFGGTFTCSVINTISGVGPTNVCSHSFPPGKWVFSSNYFFSGSGGNNASTGWSTTSASWTGSQIGVSRAIGTIYTIGGSGGASLSPYTATLTTTTTYYCLVAADASDTAGSAGCNAQRGY